MGHKLIWEKNQIGIDVVSGEILALTRVTKHIVNSNSVG